MINNYEIKKINNEEILYIYFDYNFEFALFNKSDKEFDIKKQVLDFIKKNKIAFKGSIISIVVGGLLMSNIKLNNDDFNYINNLGFTNYNVEEVSNDINSLDSNEDINISDEELATEIIYSNNVEDNIPISNTLGNNIENDIHDFNTLENNIENGIPNSNTLENNIENDIPISNMEESIIEDVNTSETIEDNNIYVIVHRRNGGVETLELNDYLIGVVSAEMPALFNEQALMAQAIVARTYTLKAISRGQVLTDNESTQSYKSNSELLNMWGSSYDTYYNKIATAVYNTSSLYLEYNGDYIEALYHSTSNGKTESSVNVWGNFYPYLVSVDSSYDSTNPSFIHESVMSYEQVSNKLGLSVNYDTTFDILEYTTSNRINKISVDETIFDGVTFRNKLGLRSTDIEIIKNSDSITFRTKGYGHGVGMSQYGANGMAKAGYSYEDILLHYYPGVRINSL